MSTRRSGLGRGLGALIPTAPIPAPVAPAAPVYASPSAPADVAPSEPQADEPSSGLRAPEGASFAEIPLDQITPNPRQPREQFDEDALGRWVELFCETVDEDFAGPLAEEAKARAAAVAGVLGTLARRVQAA